MKLSAVQQYDLVTAAYGKVPEGYTDEALGRALELLNTDDLELLNMRLVKNYTFREMGDVLYISASRVRILYNKVLYKMRSERFLCTVQNKPYNGVTVDSNLRELNISQTSLHSLYRAGYNTIKDVIGSSYTALLKIRGFGTSSLNVLKKELDKNGISYDSLENTNPEDTYKIVRLKIDKDRLQNGGVIVVSFKYNERTGDCKVINVR